MTSCLFCGSTGANPLQTNGLGHTARAYAKEGEVSTVLLEWEGKVGSHLQNMPAFTANRHLYKPSCTQALPPQEVLVRLLIDWQVLGSLWVNTGKG